MPTTNPISPLTLLDCLQDLESIIIHEVSMPHLRRTMTNLGYGVEEPISTTPEDVMSAAEDLVSTGEARFNEETGCLSITEKGMQS